MTAIDSSIILPPQAKAPQHNNVGRNENSSAEKTGQGQKEFTAALTEAPPKQKTPPSKPEKPATTGTENAPQEPQVHDVQVKGKAIQVLLEKLAQGQEIDPALLEKAQTGDMAALKEILLSLGFETDTPQLENIAGDAPQGQIVAMLAQLLQQQQPQLQAGTPPPQKPAAPLPFTPGTALLLAQEDRAAQQMPQLSQQPKDAEAALLLKDQPRPAPAPQTANVQPQPPQQVQPQAQQQSNIPQPAVNNALQTGANGFGDGGFTGGQTDGGFPQQGTPLQTGLDGQLMAGQDGRTGQQSALPQFAAAKAAGSFQSPAMHKVFLTMQRNAAERIQQMTLQLEPAAMGRVAVRMVFGKDGAMKAHLLVEKPETFQMLSRDSHALEKALKEAGLDLGENALSFDLASGQDQFEKAETQRDSGQGFHFYMQEDDSGMNAAEQAAAMMNAASANDYVLKKDGINILI